MSCCSICIGESPIAFLPITTFVKKTRVQKLTCVLCSHTSDFLGSLDRPRVHACAEGDVVLSLWVHLRVLRDETLLDH